MGLKYYFRRNHRNSRWLGAVSFWRSFWRRKHGSFWRRRFFWRQNWRVSLFFHHKIHKTLWSISYEPPVVDPGPSTFDLTRLFHPIMILNSVSLDKNWLKRMKTKLQLDLAQTRPNQKNQRKKVKRVKKAKKLARADFDLDPFWQTQNPTTKKNLRKHNFA